MSVAASLPEGLGVASNRVGLAESVDEIEVVGGLLSLLVVLLKSAGIDQSWNSHDANFLPDHYDQSRCTLPSVQ
jgi:hypothetical protein